ncbi:MAG: PqqD family protein [Pseudorhodobacter sp.]|nr:PqqD family protein [Frankiaceae bacterium]
MAPRLGPPDPLVTRREVDGSLMLLHASEPRVIVLNQTASDVWTLCDGTSTLAEIVDVLARAYGVEAAVIRSDVESTVERFLAEGFLPAPAP